jgi:hypothetical protein
MHNPFVVGQGKSSADVSENVSQISGLELPLALEASGKSLTLQKLHRNERHSAFILGPTVQDLDHVGAADRSGDLSLAPEASKNFCTLCVPGVYEFNRNFGAQFAILGTPNRPHSTSA